MEDFKNLVLQVGLTWVIGLLGFIAFGLVFAGFVVLWNFIGTFF
jgi:hypothetical protein